MEGVATFLLPGKEQVTITVKFPTPSGEDTTLKEMAISSRAALDKFLEDAILSFRFVKLPMPLELVEEIPEKEKEEMN